MRVVIIALMAGSIAWTAAAGSLFNAAVQERGTLISQQQERFEEGDIIMVLVEESLTAETEANTDTQRRGGVESEARAAQNQFLLADRPDGFGIMQPGQLPNWSIEVDNEHRASGATERANTLRTTISCVVKEISDNGNILIEGNKKIRINREDTELTLKGMVRPRDVTTRNTVNSTEVANVDLDLKGEGPLWNNQRRGLLTRFLDWFSPF
ncbi:MAG: flagellar basal body L-ring protein FlgH [Candidatus Hydrogenedentota bacterium]